MAELPAIVVRIDAGTAEPSWCDTCMQMCAVTIPLYVLGPVSVSHIGDAVRCLQCAPLDDGEDDE